MPKSQMRHILIIEGNIGAGKSTLLRLLSEHFAIDPVCEPLERWQNVGNGDNLLDRFYKDINRWAYTFQTYAFVTRVLEQENNSNKQRQMCKFSSVQYFAIVIVLQKTATRWAPCFHLNGNYIAIGSAGW